MKVYALTPDSEEQGSVVVARTSRSPSTFDVIQWEVREKGHEKFLETNVLGYGHDSVAEGAQCPWIAIENISDLAANVVACADPQLRVQMTSTRYQDMASRPVFTGDVGNEIDGAVGAAMKSKYMAGMREIDAILAPTDHPAKRTLQCDIARAFLPAGISTQLGIRGDARTMRDAICYMLGYPLPEVREAGEKILASAKSLIEVLLDRHVKASVSSAPRMAVIPNSEPGTASFVNCAEAIRNFDGDVYRELCLWRESGYRRRLRVRAAPFGPYLTGQVSSDYGAYRDLRRNRTIHQDDMAPSPQSLPKDALWAFRGLYPDVCAQIDGLTSWRCGHEAPETNDPYLAPMGAMMTWRQGGHVFDWAYMIRLRSGSKCHPAYALPMRAYMRDLLAEDSYLASAMGIVESPKSLLGVEFNDRVPT